MMPGGEQKERATCHPSHGYFLRGRVGKCGAAVVRIHRAAAVDGRPECGYHAQPQPGLPHAEQASRARHLYSRTQISIPGTVARDPAAEQPEHSLCANIFAFCSRSRRKESRNERIRTRASASHRNSSSQGPSRAIPITFCERSINSTRPAGLRRSWRNPGCEKSPGASRKSLPIAGLNLSTKRTAMLSPRLQSHRRSLTACWSSDSTPRTGSSGLCCAPPSRLRRRRP